MDSIEEKLKEFNAVRFICWKCKKELHEEDRVTVTDGDSITVELCHDCYEFYKEVRIDM